MSNNPSIEIKIITPIVILAALFGIAWLISANPPQAPRRGGDDGPQLTVETVTLKPVRYEIQLESYGTVQPRTRSQLVSQVNGQIVEISDQFREGGYFSQGDALLRIDDRDFAADVDIAKATLLDAEQALAEAEARTSQALADWVALGNEGEPPALVARKPQLMAAQARVASAQAALTKARLSLERTVITAPFDGRVLSQSVDLGQVVSPNTALGEVFATDRMEVRLPLRDRDLPFIDLPRADGDAPETTAPVRLVSTLGDNAEWLGQLSRTESAIDPNARQLHVIAQLDDMMSEGGDVPVRVGQYVAAQVQGKTIEDALIVPNAVITQGTFVFVVEDNVLNRRRVDVLWQNDVESLIGGGVVAGEQVVITQLGQVSTGTRVRVLNSADNDRRDAGTNSPGSSAAAGGGAQ